MREIVTAVEMKELDHNTIQKAGISSPVLMERAALKTVEEIVQRLKNKEKEKILMALQGLIAIEDKKTDELLSKLGGLFQSKISNWIEVDLSKEPDQLGKFLQSFPIPINEIDDDIGS